MERIEAVIQRVGRDRFNGAELRGADSECVGRLRELRNKQ
jgi:hypothetical protein